MRRLAAELTGHFRNIIVMQTLGANSKSLEATQEQIKTLEEHARLADPSRIFKICDQLAEMEDKLRYVLSVRTLIEMSLIRASRIATTASIEEIMRAIRALRSEVKPETRPTSAPAPVNAPAPAPTSAPVSTSTPESAQESGDSEHDEALEKRRKILEDPKLDSILRTFPGSRIIDIKGA